MKVILLCLLSSVVFNAHTQTIPLDAQVRTGQLENGFTYFIRHNAEPVNRVQLYLVNKVGSILEDEDQRGLAHFMEHMNFNGTKHFPKNELVHYLEKSGVKFGADLNAYTSFDETVYQLPLPTDDAVVLQNGLLIMRDWAQEALLDSAEINGERGVVLEERRLGMGAGERLQRKYFPMLLNQSRYANRLPIGNEEILQHFKPSAIQRFKRDWYRPDLQALIVVGDIDVDAIEAQVKQLFGDLLAPTVKRPNPRFRIVLSGRNQYLQLTDPELSTTEVQIIVKHKGAPLKTKMDYRQSIIRSLFNQLFAARLGELVRAANPPMLRAAGGIDDFMAGLHAFTIDMGVKPGGIQTALEAAFREMERVRRFGFTSTELERAKAAYLAWFTSLVKEKDKTSSRSYVQEYQQYFLTQQAAPGIDAEFALVKGFLPSITGADLLRVAADYIQDKDRDILILAPEKEKGNLPGAVSVNQWVRKVQLGQIDPYVDEVGGQTLIEKAPVAGSIVHAVGNASLGTVEYGLSNGVRVIIKPTDFKNDEILFYGFGPGGSSLSNDSDFASASNAANLVRNFGIGSFNVTALQKMLAGKQVNVAPYLAERTQGINGFSVPSDLETALQLTYLYFTAPRKDEGQFTNIIERSKATIANRYNDPRNVFADTVSFVLGNYNLRRAAPSLAQLDQLNLERLLAIYRERFGNVNGFTFVVVGAVDTAVLRPLLEKYVASLPATGGEVTARDLGIRIPSGQLSKLVKKGKEDKATVRLVYSGAFDASEKNKLILEGLAGILEFRLTDRLRESEGGVYSPSVQATTSKLPAGRYAITVNFGCAPANVEKLIGAVEQEIARLKGGDALGDDLAKFIAESAREWEKDQRDNQFWINWLVNHYQDGDDPAFVEQYLAMLRSITVNDIQAAAANYLSGVNRIQFVLLPE